MKNYLMYTIYRKFLDVNIEKLTLQRLLSPLLTHQV